MRVMKVNVAGALRQVKDRLLMYWTYSGAGTEINPLTT